MKFGDFGNLGKTIMFKPQHSEEFMPTFNESIKKDFKGNDKSTC